MGCWKNQVNNQGILKQICLEKKTKVWTEEQERGFRQKAQLEGMFFLGRASYRVVVEEKPLDAEEHFVRKNIWVSGLWLEKSDYPP